MYEFWVTCPMSLEICKFTIGMDSQHSYACNGDYYKLEEHVVCALSLCDYEW